MFSYLKKTLESDIKAAKNSSGQQQLIEEEEKSSH